MKSYENNPLLEGLSLGKDTQYRSHYDAGLLQAVPRSLNRQELSITTQLPFDGIDIWHAYELSWLNEKGKPVVALARVCVNAASVNIVESKSFKLYLNGFNQTRFTSVEHVQSVLVADLTQVAQGDVTVEIIQPNDISSLRVQDLPGDCIDDQDIKIDDFILDSTLLRCTAKHEVVDEVLHSHLLKSNCLITDQPDWASVVIRYHGAQIDREFLLRYLISFRLHNEFHEQCVERIFTDIMENCQPQRLSVQALYTRRGGLDINPYRTTPGNFNGSVPNNRVNRQ